MNKEFRITLSDDGEEAYIYMPSDIHIDSFIVILKLFRNNGYHLVSNKEGDGCWKFVKDK